MAIIKHKVKIEIIFCYLLHELQQEYLFVFKFK